MEATTSHNASEDCAPAFSRAATLWFSLATTCVVILLPTGVVSVAMRATEWSPRPATMWLTTASLSLAILMFGTRWWMRQPGSTNMSFGELMVWRWVRRRRADDVVQESAHWLVPTEVRTRNGQLEMLRELNAALEVRDPYTRGHSRRVERHAYRTALAMHRSVDDIFNLRIAASLHDIGKTEVPIEVIRKQGPLDDAEWASMKSHPVTGAQMIENIGHEALVLAVRHHHERWDGTGYPKGLAGEDIPLHARIIAVCDTFDAITSTRSYRSKSTRDTALNIIKKNSGTQFDPAVVDAFLSGLPRGLPGVAALSWLSFPAVQKGFAQASMMLREAGVAGVAGAVVTSGVAGAVATGAVDPGKYLHRPAITRAQEDERSNERAKHRPNDNGDTSSSSVATADAAAGGVSSVRRTKVTRAAHPGRSQRKSQTAEQTSKRSDRAEQATGQDKENKEKPAKPEQSNGDGGHVATTQGGGTGAVEEEVEVVEEVTTEVVEETIAKIPPGQTNPEGHGGPPSGGKNGPK